MDIIRKIRFFFPLCTFILVIYFFCSWLRFSICSHSTLTQWLVDGHFIVSQVITNGVTLSRKEKKNPFTFLFMSHSMINSTHITNTMVGVHHLMTQHTTHNTIQCNKHRFPENCIYGNQICGLFCWVNDMEVDVDVNIDVLYK